MYKLRTTNKFDKSLKKCFKRGLPKQEFNFVLTLLLKKEKLPKRFKAHMLKGNYKGCWECHIKPDWLLIWEEKKDELVLLLIDTGSHSELF